MRYIRNKSRRTHTDNRAWRCSNTLRGSKNIHGFSIIILSKFVAVTSSNSQSTSSRKISTVTCYSAKSVHLGSHPHLHLRPQVWCSNDIEGHPPCRPSNCGTTLGTHPPALYLPYTTSDSKRTTLRVPLNNKAGILTLTSQFAGWVNANCEFITAHQVLLIFSTFFRFSYSTDATFCSINERAT